MHAISHSNSLKFKCARIKILTFKCRSCKYYDLSGWCIYTCAYGTHGTRVFQWGQKRIIKFVIWFPVYTSNFQKNVAGEKASFTTLQTLWIECFDSSERAHQSKQSSGYQLKQTTHSQTLPVATEHALFCSCFSCSWREGQLWRSSADRLEFSWTKGPQQW